MCIFGIVRPVDAVLVEYHGLAGGSKPRIYCLYATVNHESMDTLSEAYAHYNALVRITNKFLMITPLV